MLVVVVLSRACHEVLNASSIRDPRNATFDTWERSTICWLLELLLLLQLLVSINEPEWGKSNATDEQAEVSAFET